MKQYISPISFLPAGATGNLTARDLKLARQKLMAEFELSGSASVMIGGKEMTRNDVIQMFDELEQADDLGYHTVVASDPVLLKFLEQGALSAGDKFAILNEQITPAFVEWISPCFAWAFSKAVLQMFRDVRPEEFETLVVQPTLMTPNDELDAWHKLDLYLDNKVHEFIELNNKKYFPPHQQKQFTEYNMVWLVCNLPVDHFQKFINEYAFQMMRLAITVFNKGQRNHAFDLLTWAQSLKVSADIRSKLVAKEKEMNGLISKSKNSETWHVIRIILFILFVVTRLARCA